MLSGCVCVQRRDTLVGWLMDWAAQRQVGQSFCLFSRCRQDGAGGQSLAGFVVEFNEMAPGLAVCRLESLGSSTRYTVAGVALGKDPTDD